MWGGFEVAEEVDEEMVGVSGACVFILSGVGLVRERVASVVMPFAGIVETVTVGEDGYFVDAKDGEGARDVAGEGGSLIVGLGAFLTVSDWLRKGSGEYGTWRLYCLVMRH